MFSITNHYAIELKNRIYHGGSDRREVLAVTKQALLERTTIDFRPIHCRIRCFIGLRVKVKYP